MEMEQPTAETYHPNHQKNRSPSTSLGVNSRPIDILELTNTPKNIEMNSSLSLSDNLIIGTRNSKLALIQADLVEREINKRFTTDQLKTEIQSMSTSGDENLLKPLYLLRDVPTTLPAGCELASVMLREDPRDALIIRNGPPFTHLSQLPPGSIIGTSSVRRVAQLRRQFPNLAFQDIRGNLQTRFKKLDATDSPYTGIILAVAGLKRIGLATRITSYLEPPDLYHAVGQGAIGIEIRTPPAMKLNKTLEETILRERATTVRKRGLIMAPPPF
ncbi:hypothetical protein Pst134EA_013830 [Puccinia striiformis f. sp. tritici]|uniref:hypothetical protein n=1 Tax=Puccinia striiformis f. sp. tritici TaxID=168172 RepID=UPI002008AE55|nr:hypothetical protein Pst134EA_013830 [Puccinia striiformis f. sp. tritici]KAH9465976.1 hypothetical protein Pst134EA_013830 [Puccinia striiformis f. sp. tritici]